jgi:hypothetical protein
LFNQIERDFNTAFIPDVDDSVKPKKKPKKKEEKVEQEEEKETKPKKSKSKKSIIYFLAQADTDESKRINDKKYNPFKKVSLVNTNPLQVWGQDRPRIVRVGYELVKGSLHRKETVDLKNSDLKAPDESAKNPVPVRSTVVATNIKEMYIEYSMTKQKKKNKKNLEKPEPKPITAFTWGNRKETKNIVPQKAEIIITFLGNKIQSEKTYSCLIPIFSHPTAKKEKKPKKKAEKEEPGGKKAKRRRTQR